MNMVWVWGSIVVAAAIFVVGEFFVPVDPKADNRRVQKHFWATTLSIIGLVLALLFTFISNTTTKLSKVEDAVTVVTGSVAGMTSQQQNEEFWDIFVGTERMRKEDDDVSGMLRTWADAAIARMRADVEEGFFPLEQDIESSVIDLLQAVNDDARQMGALPSVIATNVGGTSTYFESWYRNAHTDAVELGVPIIRFFIHDPRKEIEITESTDREIVDMERFRAEVEGIHTDFRTVFSAVIDTEHCPLAQREPRDYLFVNGSLLLMTEVRDWKLGRVRATGRLDNLDNAREYLSDLWLCLDEVNEFQMSGSEVTELFSAHLDEYGLDGNAEDLGKRLAELIVRQ